MNSSIYEDLPEDPELAFAQLEEHFRSELQANLDETEEGHVITTLKGAYANQVIASAKALGIEGIKDYEVPTRSNDIWDFYETFAADVMNLVIQIRINHGRRKQQYSVKLDGTEKQKIRHYIEQIKQLVEKSDLDIDKKERIYKRLSALTLEVDRDRTRLEAVADGVMAVARLSRDFEREGAQPWWKWGKLILGTVDEAKEKEGWTQLPGPVERKKLEAPRKSHPASKSDDLDDEIPF